MDMTDRSANPPMPTPSPIPSFVPLFIAEDSKVVLLDVLVASDKVGDCVAVSELGLAEEVVLYTATTALIKRW
jgi:hypothetical protein